MSDDDVLFRMQLTEDGVLTITKLPNGLMGDTPESALAGILRLVAASLESGDSRLVEGEVPA